MLYERQVKQTQMLLNLSLCFEVFQRQTSGEKQKQNNKIWVLKQFSSDTFFSAYSSTETAVILNLLLLMYKFNLYYFVNVVNFESVKKKTVFFNTVTMLAVLLLCVWKMLKKMGNYFYILLKKSKKSKNKKKKVYLLAGHLKIKTITHRN